MSYVIPQTVPMLAALGRPLRSAGDLLIIPTVGLKRVQAGKVPMDERASSQSMKIRATEPGEPATQKVRDVSHSLESILLNPEGAFA